MTIDAEATCLAVRTTISSVGKLCPATRTASALLRFPCSRLLTSTRALKPCTAPPQPQRKVPSPLYPSIVCRYTDTPPHRVRSPAPEHTCIHATSTRTHLPEPTPFLVLPSSSSSMGSALALTFVHLWYSMDRWSVYHGSLPPLS
ncbi:hypothetical protein BDQ17DRAFT_1371971 [Cyathus striatus]|nr:hypothetical protein BDQ17DRAFT_1371971 [Cyathus striatus]